MFHCVKHTSHILGQNVFCHDTRIFSGLNLKAFSAFCVLWGALFAVLFFYHFSGQPGNSGKQRVKAGSVRAVVWGP